jgi:hypothetical protein
MKTIKCFSTGCKNPAKYKVTKLFGDKGTFHNCENCKPDINKRPESIRHLPFFYNVQAI